MFSEDDDLMGSSADTNAGDGDVSLNRRECPHCKLWFRMDEAKRDAKNKLRCPYCGWEIQSSQ